MIGTILPAHMAVIRKIQDDVRRIAKDNGVKVRRHQFSGIDVKYPDGTKQHYHGWIQLKQHLVNQYGAP